MEIDFPPANLWWMVAPPTCSTALGWTGVTNQQARSTAVRHLANHGLGVGTWACINNPLRTPVLSDTDRTCKRRWLVADADGKTGLLLLRCILTIDECTHQWYLEEEQQPSRPKRLTMGSILRCRNELASFKISISSDTCNNPKSQSNGGTFHVHLWSSVLSGAWLSWNSGLKLESKNCTSYCHYKYNAIELKTLLFLL